MRNGFHHQCACVAEVRQSALFTELLKPHGRTAQKRLLLELRTSHLISDMLVEVLIDRLNLREA